MRQPEDTKTLELLQDQKRGRGRPRAENPLTPAERAKRYREKRRGFRGVGGTRSPADEFELIESLNSDAKIVTENNSSDDVEFWRGMYEAEAERVAELEARIAVRRDHRKVGFSYAQITEITENQIICFMSRAATEKDHATALQVRSWAYGAYLVWGRLTYGYQAGGDDKRLCDLTTFY